MDPAGLRLKKIRLEKGLSLEEVHKHTKIHLNILKAIEEDSLINLNPVYIKGFLKIYCNFLGLEPRDYIADYREVRTLRQAVPGPEEKKRFSANIRTRTQTLAVMREVRRHKKNIIIVSGVIIFIFLVFNIGKALSSRRGPSQPRARQPEEKVAIAEKKGESSKEQKKQGGHRQAESFSREDAASIVRLSIRARENCLVQLKSDGKVVFYGTLARGRSESWHAKSKMELYLGNAGVVDLEVNGKSISNLGKRGQTIKNISISKEGLEIGR